MSQTSRRAILQALPAALLFVREAGAQAKGRYVVGPTKIARNRAPNQVVLLGSGPHLFLDDYLVLHQEGLARTTHHPCRLPQPIITSKEFGVWQPFVTVVRDAEKGVFRMWYDAWSERPGIAKGNYLAYAESKDGVEWRAPELSVIGKSNLLMPILNGYGGSLIDEGPAFKDRARRFKLAWWGRKDPESDVDSGMFVAFSPDGLQWTPSDRNPVLPNFPDESDPRYPQAAGDVIDVFWDPIAARYAAFIKTPAIPEDGWLQAPKANKNLRRLVSFSVSTDFVRWEMPWRVIVPGERDEGTLEFYAAGGTIARGGLLVGCPRMLRDDLPADPGGPPEGIGYATLVTSRDGESWERHSDVFFNRNLDPESWDHAMTWVGCQLLMADEVYLYYGGYKQGHKINRRSERQLGLAKLRRDGYVSRDAFGPDPGWLMTPLLRSERITALTVSAEASRGEIRVQVLDHRRQIVPGFSFQECAPLRGDGLRQAVTWSGGASVTRLQPDPFHLEFRVTDARLYGFEFDGNRT
jgi:hypothetical protein